MGVARGAFDPRFAPQCDALITRITIRRQRFLTGLPRLVPAAGVLRNDDLRLQHGLGQAVRRVARLRRVAEIDPHLLRVLSVTLAAIAVGLLQELVDRELLLLDHLFELRDLGALLQDRTRLLDQRIALRVACMTQLDDEPLAGGKIVGKQLRVVHSSYHSNAWGMDKHTLPRILPQTKPGPFTRVLRERPPPNNHPTGRVGKLAFSRPARNACDASPSQSSRR